MSLSCLPFVPHDSEDESRKEGDLLPSNIRLWYGVYGGENLLEILL